VNFTGPLTGWVAGDSGTILRTINGGSGWTAQSAPTTNTLYGVRVIEPVGFVVGDRSILRTTNSGAEWREFNTGSTAVYRAVSSNHFSNVVIAGSFGSGPGADPVPLLRHSTDLGVTWQSASGMFPLGEFFGVSMHRYANIDAVGTGGRVYRSTNGGITWGPAFNPAISTLRAVSYSDSLHGWAAGDEGVVLTTRDGVPMPQPLLLYPTSGEVVQLSGTVQLAWLPPPGVTTRIQLGEDPSFSTMVLLDSTFTSSESRVDAPPLARSSRYFWRVNHTQPNLTNGWSQAAYFYTGGFGVTTVHEIQFVPSGQLISADAVQNTNPAAFWTRQASPVNPLDTVRLTACCAVPPGVLATGAAYSMIVLDPDTSYGRWAGLLVEADSNVGGYIAGIGEGEIISIDGTVLERPQPSMGSMTILKATGIRLLGGGGAVRTVPATVETFYTGAYPGGSIRFSGGEPLEGMIVRMENLVVDSVLDPLAGTFTMTDRTGNSFTMSDASRWFTLGPHRDPLSAYAPPAPGDFIGAIRGVIVTSPDSADTRGYMIAPIYPGDLSILPHAAGVIAGTVFGDANFNGVLDPGEPPLPGWDVHLSGGAQLSAHPDASGKFKFIYLDSGSYSFGVGTKPGWMITHPASGSYNISLGVDDTAADNFIGLNYGGSMVRGILFEDGNRNGVQDSGEGGMPSWTIILDGHRGGTGAWVHRSERTDANGAYRIDSLQWGTYTVTAADSLYWFQSLPESTAGHPVGIGQGVTVLTDRNFGRYRQVKVKIGISVADRAGFNHTVSWGVVPGASFGVWQADPGATLTDTLEGELEIPPRSFARLVGFFDSRFTDPHYPLEFESPRFGQGSWTDVREYEYPVQSDTFLLSFLPSYLGGGGYPMTLRWSRDQMAYSYGGPVVLRGGDGVATDMKTSDSIVVTSTAVEWCSIIATNPNIPPSWIAGWRLVSLPVPVLSGDYRSVFPSARSQAYTFDPGGGYTPRDTMVAGEGYWLKYREAMDPLTFNPSDRLLDTIPVRLGWNLIGALSSPITPGAVIPIPPGLIRGDFFGFDDGYYISTTLLPGRAYWVNVSADGSLILDATLNGKVRTAGTAGERLNGLSRLEFTDAGGRRSGFYLTTDTAFVSGPLGLPPVPPSGCFDARLTPERLVEVISPDVALKTPVKISSAIYPITVRWSITGGMNNLSIVAGEYTIPVSGNGEAEIRDAALPLLLRVDVGTIMPEAFSLRQNYPNPFNPLTTIRYDLPVDSRVTLRVFDMLGREVASLIDGIQTAGFKELRFDATPYPSGIYFLRITAGSYTAVRKMVLIK
ncbi:MAG TPA: SdrD B-like domain-containing protein, partial [Bacteroidota bacterium]|nr:SdrD B-like domain-containing protein [Bacteroidota bacterium]